MITLVEALHFRCLRHVHQPLGRFEVLAGPHASGKSAFLDAIRTLARLVSDGLEAARLGSWRNWNPAWKIPLAACAASVTARHSAGVSPMGFSQ